MEKIITRTRLALGAAALLALIVVPVALAATDGGSQATVSAAGVKKKIKRLAERVGELEQANASLTQANTSLTQQVAELQGEQGGGRPPTGEAGGDLTANYPNPEIGAGAVSSAEVADRSLTGADIDRGTEIVLCGTCISPGVVTSLADDGLFTGFGGSGNSGASTEVRPALVELSEHDIFDVWTASLSPTELSFSSSDSLPLNPADPGESRYEMTVTLPEISPDNPPANSALIYVRDSGGITQLVARFADGDIDVLAEEAP
jgi:cell division protein FtsB